MKVIELPLSEQINLRTSGHIQHATTELKDGEEVMVDMIGICNVKSDIKGLVELRVVKRLWVRDEKGELMRIE